MRCIDSSRDLEEISSPISLSPHLLRSDIGSARICIHQIQMDLDLDLEDLGYRPANDVSYAMEDSVSISVGYIMYLVLGPQKCLKCDKEFPISELLSHVKGCKITNTRLFVMIDDRLVTMFLTSREIHKVVSFETFINYLYTYYKVI